MNALYQWVGSILCFLIFATMVQALLPTKQYEKYLRLFIGMVLILLVTQPLTGSLRLEDRIAYYFETITFQNDTQDLSREILGIEKQRLEKVIASYEQAVELDVKMMVEDAGLQAESVEVTIDGDQDSETYGTVTHVAICVGAKTDEAEKEGVGIQPIEIETVKVQVGDSAEAGDNGEIGGQGIEGQELEANGVPDRAVVNEDVGRLRRKVEQYYGLESKEVEIRYKVR